MNRLLRTYKYRSIFDIETRILHYFHSGSIFASDRTDACRTLTKTTLRSAFHEKHVSELCFEKEEDESVEKEEFSPQQFQHRYLGMLFMIEQHQQLLFEQLLCCYAFQKCSSNLATRKFRHGLEVPVPNLFD